MKPKPKKKAKLGRPIGSTQGRTHVKVTLTVPITVNDRAKELGINKSEAATEGIRRAIRKAERQE